MPWIKSVSEQPSAPLNPAGQKWWKERAWMTVTRKTAGGSRFRSKPSFGDRPGQWFSRGITGVFCEWLVCFPRIWLPQSGSHSYASPIPVSEWISVALVSRASSFHTPPHLRMKPWTKFAEYSIDYFTFVEQSCCQCLNQSSSLFTFS